MCEIKPGPRCANDTRADAASTRSRYTDVHPNGPVIDPLERATALMNTPSELPERALVDMVTASEAPLPDGGVTTWSAWHAITSCGTRVSDALAVLDASGHGSLLPELNALHGVPQDPAWHPEGDVHVHSGLAADKGAALADDAGLRGEDRTVVVLASLLHDLGKATHTQMRDQDGSTRITSHGHASAGVEPARAFLRRIGAPQRIQDRVLPLVAEHMAHVSVKSVSRAAARRLARRLAPATIQEWVLVVGADKGGRGSASGPHGVEAWLAGAPGDPPTPRILTGRHLIGAGLRPGAHFRVLLDEAEEAQDAGKFADEAGALEWLRDRLNRGWD